jgi:hypothetical protein
LIEIPRKNSFLQEQALSLIDFFSFFPQFCEVKELVIALVKIMLEKQICPEFSQIETCQNEYNPPIPGIFGSIL